MIYVAFIHTIDGSLYTIAVFPKQHMRIVSNRGAMAKVLGFTYTNIGI